MADDCGAMGAVGGLSVAHRRRNVPRLAHPLDNLIFVEAIPAKALTTGGLALPETQADSWESPLCLVIAAGPGCKREFVIPDEEEPDDEGFSVRRPIRAGDVLIVQNSCPAGKLRYDAWEWLVINEEQVAGVMDPEEVRRAGIVSKNPDLTKGIG